MKEIRHNINSSLLILLSMISFSSKGQLENIKIILPKETGFSYYDFLQFSSDEKYFFVCANSLSVYQTETAEIVDEYELGYGARNLSVHPAGKFIALSLNNEVFLFSFEEQKLKLVFKKPLSEFIQGLPNAAYYGNLPISACHFTGKGNELYIVAGSFSLLYDTDKKTNIASHAMELSSYIIHSAYYPKGKYTVLACINGSVSSLIKQNINNLTETTPILTQTGTLTKLKIKDSLVFCFTADKYFVMNLQNGQIIHEIRMPKIKHSSLFNYDKKYLDQLNKRPSITLPDTIHFAKDEYVYDIDYLTQQKLLVYATSKEIKYYDPIKKTITRRDKNFTMNIKVSPSGKRLVSNSFSTFKSLKVFDTGNHHLLAERPALSTAIYSSDISKDNKWMITKTGGSAFLWDMRNFTKYAEIKDISNNDSSFINSIFFMNDSILVVNSGTNIEKLNLSLYSIPKKKYIKTIRKGVFAFTSGFLNNEFYYCDYGAIHIINLKTLTEEKYEGLFTLAASPMYKVVYFTDNLVFIPQSGKYKIVHRKTKDIIYESEYWSVNANVVISPDEKYLYTSGVKTLKKNYSGTEIEIPTNAILRVDLNKKKIDLHYAETNFPYDFILFDEGKKIGIWYVKTQTNQYDPLKNEVVYTEYNCDDAKVLSEKSLITTSVIPVGHYTSANGKYFALDNMTGNLLKVFNREGIELVDLSDLKYTLPKLYFDETKNRLIITGPVNSLATFINLENGQLIGQLANAPGDQYFLITKDLYYLGSKDFVKQIRFKYDSEMFSFEQFDAYLNQPHRVLRAFACSDSLLIKTYETAYNKRIKLLGIKKVLKLNFGNAPSFQHVVMQALENEKVKFSISINKGKNPLNKLEIYNNGSMVYSSEIPLDNTGRHLVNLEFETTTGINRFEFVAKDMVGIESQRINRFFNNTSSKKPTLYLVVMASEKFKNTKFDLSYALKDAGDIAKTMINSGSFEKIELKKLYNHSFNSDSVAALQKYFSQAGINDVAMVFFAGHGYLDDDLSYYFPTYYTDFNDPKTNAVPYKVFEALFKDMKPIRKLMFIDACFSGEVDEDLLYNDDNENTQDTTRIVRTGSAFLSQSTALEMSKSIFSDLRQNSGATVISSAGGTEAAFESDKWKNGLFTYCLLQGINELKADLNHDGKIMLSELQKYVAEEVYKISNGKQSPTYRTENIILDYELWEKRD